MGCFLFTLRAELERPFRGGFNVVTGVFVLDVPGILMAGQQYPTGSRITVRLPRNTTNIDKLHAVRGAQVTEAGQHS